MSILYSEPPQVVEPDGRPAQMAMAEKAMMTKLANQMFINQRAYQRWHDQRGEVQDPRKPLKRRKP